MKFVNSLFWLNNDFEIESKYQRKICYLVVLAHILSSQNVVFRSMFFLIEMVNVAHQNVITIRLQQVEKITAQMRPMLCRKPKYIARGAIIKTR